MRKFFLDMAKKKPQGLFFLASRIFFLLQGKNSCVKKNIFAARKIVLSALY